MAGYATDCDTAFGTIGKNPNERGKTSYGWTLTKTTPMLGAEREMRCIYEHQKNNKKEVSKRWLGSCPMPYFRNDHHPKTPETKRIPVLNRIIHPTQSIPLRTAEYSLSRFIGKTRLACPELAEGLGGVRDALRSYLGAEPSTRLCVVFLSDIYIE